MIITATAFGAYLKCPTKASLLLLGDEASETFFTDLDNATSKAYKARMRDASPVDFPELSSAIETEAGITLVDAETAIYRDDGLAPLKTVDLVPKRRPRHPYVPVLRSPGDKPERDHGLLVSFCALAIAQATEATIPSNGWVIHGDEQRTKIIDVTKLIPRVQQIIQAIAEDCRRAEPLPAVMNKHCSICDYQTRCRTIATKAEDLSLLTAMGAKERRKFIDKGITNLTQLSYGYRPRRRKTPKSTKRRSDVHYKHDNKLKALAIKKGQVHVVGSPEFDVAGTSVFIDVEGTTGGEWYYLIGIRHAGEGRGSHVEHSFWADRREHEARIWRQCLKVLQAIDNPRLVHYGAYESRFLKLMRERYKLGRNDAAFVDQLIVGSINILSSVYAKIYFPTYSNGLKEVARWLGFRWTWRQASGAGAALLRRGWELCSDDKLKRKLIAYNIEDCRATELVAEAITTICGKDAPDQPAKLAAVNVGSLEVGFQRTFGKFSSALPEFGRINAAAYWDYQRSKVYVRTDKTIRRTVRRAAKRTRKVSVEKEVVVDDRPESCPRCGSAKIWVARRASATVFDLKFTRRGIKRWAARYHYNNYRCGGCKAQMTPNRVASKYGPNLRAYAIYLLIEMRLSNQKISEHISTVFDIDMVGTMINAFKRDLASKYELTHAAILKEITEGVVVHADETKGVVFGGGHYVWIFANLTSAAYVYSASRDAETVHEVLTGFKGVLVSDFYGGYDSLPCQQQKCLIHLMRDINEDVLKHPFNDELGFIAKRFGALLREIVETIDKYGLKKFHLAKHKPSAERFLAEVAKLHCSTDVGSALKKRIEKNRDKLFTFLHHDGVPWNNNNAEHAVRAFTRLRNVMFTSTPRGTRDYCILLTLQQTLRYRGMGFLDFLRTGRTLIAP